jgi:hypothetical protein
MKHQSDDDPPELYAALVAHAEGAPRSAALERWRLGRPELFAQRLALVRAMLSSLAAARLPEPSGAQRTARRCLDAELQHEQSRAAGGWRRLWATLVPPERLQAIALRDGEAARPRFQALYSAAGFDVDLLLDDSGALLGQVLAYDERTDPTAGTALLIGRDGSARSTAIGVDGSFVFEGRPGGSVDLVIDLADTQLLLQGVELPE